MSTSFIVRLHKAHKDFNLQEAEALSDAMRAAEVEGYEMTHTEERMWLWLTQRIQQDRAPHF